MRYIIFLEEGILVVTKLINNYHYVGPGFGVSSTWRRSGSEDDIFDDCLGDLLVAEKSKGSTTVHLLVKTLRSGDHFFLEKKFKTLHSNFIILQRYNKKVR